jgi:hypothetical protein
MPNQLFHRSKSKSQECGEQPTESPHQSCSSKIGGANSWLILLRLAHRSHRVSGKVNRAQLDLALLRRPRTGGRAALAASLLFVPRFGRGLPSRSSTLSLAI